MAHPRTLATLALLGCALPGLAPAQPAPAQGPSAAARAVDALPQELADFRRGGAITDYDIQPGRAGLGAALRYVPSSGTRAIATVYIYDLGQPRGPDGAGSPDAQQQLRQAAGDITRAVQPGRYQSATPAGGLVLTGADGLPRLRCENYRVVQQDGATTGDSVCVSILQGRYQKVRLTSWHSSDPQVAGMQAATLLSAMLDAQALQPAASGPRKGS